MSLVSLDTAKDWLGVASEDGSRDAVITIALEAAEEIIAGLLGRPGLGLVENNTERLSGNGRACIVLSRAPITGVSEIEVDSRATEVPITDLTSWNQLNAIGAPSLDDVEADSKGGLWRHDGKAWPHGTRNIKVTYTGGWTSDTLPADIRLVILQVTSMSFGIRTHEGLKSVDMGTGSWTISQPTRDDVLGIPGARATLDKYRRPAV